MHPLRSTGSKLVSLRPSNPAANSIWGTEHEPKFPMAALPFPAAAAEVVAAAAAAEVEEATVVAAAAVVEAAAAAVVAAALPVPETTRPWSSIDATAAKF